MVQRKHDYWMVPSVLVSCGSILLIIVGWAMWAAATDEKLDSCTKQIENNRAHIIILEKNTVKIQSSLSANTSTLNSIDKTVEKMIKRQDKMLDLLIETIRERKDVRP